MFRLQQQIADRQQVTLSQQQSIMEGSDSLAAKITTLQSGVGGMFEEFQLTYNKQMSAVSHIFDKLNVLEKIFLAEYTGM